MGKCLPHIHLNTVVTITCTTSTAAKQLMSPFQLPENLVWALRALLRFLSLALKVRKFHTTQVSFVPNDIILMQYFVLATSVS